MIRIVAAGKSFAGREALRGVSFQAVDGEVTALLGPNGAGKTTTLRLLGGLLRGDTGELSIDGAAAGSMEARRALGLLLDGAGQYPRLTAREHLVYFGRLRGLSRSELASALAAAVRHTELGPLLDRRTAGFSTGERRRLALAQTLLHQPHNVVLDEPTNGLDVLGARQVRRLVRELAAQGRCVLFSSHVMSEVAAVCDRVVVLASGRCVAAGTPDELLAGTGESDLEAAFVALIGSAEGLS